ncbi:MAG TPA: hypothetical protein VL461_05975 [Dictyobacter sp.]|nr:hypothetical protein [Dictyobacter sp.]
MQEDSHEIQKKQENVPAQQQELSEVWQELLGTHKVDPNKIPADPSQPAEITIPTLDSDPWSSLIHAQGVEIVDPQLQRLSISDQEVEKMLQVMQEQSAQDDEGKSKRK